MQKHLRLEEAGMLFLGWLMWQYAMPNTETPSWLFFALFLTPDVGILGYLVSPALGAMTYNFMHSKALAIGLFAVPFICAAIPIWIAGAGAILFAHASFDRLLGFGLKYRDSFYHTHLGHIKAGKSPRKDV